ncbi:retinol dehydrogenase 11 isoform X1 [Hydra vulgaris]|uniref:Retinol dehydrogenase 11 isoform X1 n=1 Tax=Hydra vulgaris TaxID=6087 RepID=A0ABM4DAD3_HYDVU
MCTTTTRLDEKVVIITGANTGIGKETAIEIAKRGGTVVMACRDLKRGQTALEDIKRLSNSHRIFLKRLDLASLSSVRKFTYEFIKEFNCLHVLINNAGIMMCPYGKTEDGFEMHFGVNHLGHFALTNLLLRHFSVHGRIINVSSCVHKYATINFEDINFEKNYCRRKAYCQSKLANVLFTRELHRKLVGSKISVYSLHPGIINTELGRHSFLKYLLWLPCFKSPMQGAQTSIYCATKEGLENESGNYFAECKLIKTMNKYFFDEGQAKKLWELSEKLTETTYPL